MCFVGVVQGVDSVGELYGVCCCCNCNRLISDLFPSFSAVLLVFQTSVTKILLYLKQLGIGMQYLESNWY